MSTFLGGELYLEFDDLEGRRVTLTYNDLWLIIVCRESLDGDWVRMREATSMVPDSARKRTLVDRLWKLEQSLEGLPEVPEELTHAQLRQAHVWFNQQTISTAKHTPDYQS